VGGIASWAWLVMRQEETTVTSAKTDFGQSLLPASPPIIWPILAICTTAAYGIEGGRVVGTEEIRAYWSRQWKEFDPHVAPIEVIDRGPADS
jgi:hypothetical protein